MKKSSRIVVANWKMNPESLEEAKKIASEIRDASRGFNKTKIIICPPFVFLNEIQNIFARSNKIVVGAQDVFAGQGVTHTGEVSAIMLKNSGMKYVIVGHSERRASGDDGMVVKKKLESVLNSGLKAIFCIGEKNRDEHGEQYNEVKEQIESALLKIPKKLISRLIVAYEPVWAIGKSENESMNPEQLHEMTIFIKKILNDIFGIEKAEKVQILYGGSVTKGNAKEIIEKGNVDGLLIGRESLKIKNFIELIKEI